MAQPPERLLVGVTGSVAAFSLPVYLHAFRTAGVKQIVGLLTRSAETFVSPGGLRALCDQVYTEAEQARSHVALARWAQRVLVLPATAHLLGCLANGLAPSALTSTLLAVEQPITVAPAMNESMWRRPAVRRNVATLRADGHRVVEPVPGTAFEAASREIVSALVLPAPDEVLRGLCLDSGVDA
ncbi:flavoprotein [Actinokineospora iranica]|uniref:Phosphopantothenoylcysteine decarboxylase / phosphopantothenate--cysteine ligase n=1 Tax=Actinokineospora iranica TaxID=1271860 RepID=A0A1G6ME55_9PSEU|nr:flavoprotein [Actinokineospora iranica]SDC53769.1 phosphopantothenoylcysteine decarboxylase / phosphopantothenate--cysteine ligase [Actinokineospora iranica]